MESIMSSYFTLTISNLRQCLGYAADNIADSEDIERWISITNSAIESLEHSIESDSNLNAAEKHKYQNFLAHLITICNKFYQFIKVGTGLTVENVQSVKWEEIKSAFQKQILSGIIVNLQHLDVPSVSLLTPQSERLRLLKTSLSNIFRSKYSSIRLSLNSSCFLHTQSLHNAI